MLDRTSHQTKQIGMFGFYTLHIVLNYNLDGTRTLSVRACF